MYYCRYSSPLGNLLIAGAEDVVVYCLWEDTIDERMMATWEEDKSEKSTALTETCRQLTEYFAGTRKVFRLPLAPKRYSLSASYMVGAATDPLR